ncbi:MAG: hypothetical protein JNJ49_16895 [Bdellovibrionaceae bacterium]|nr:hypothetical protein [Pseudobdellovibrionaceae bacterium]
MRFSNSFAVYVFAALVPFLASASEIAPQAKGEVARQREAGFNLTESAAKAILNRYAFKPKTRNDYYVEIYDGAAFLLGTSSNEYKLRLQDYSQKSVLQTARKLSIQTANCPGTSLNFNVREKETGELEIPRASRDRFIQLAETQLALLRGSDGAAFLTHAQQFKTLVSAFKVPLLPALLAVPGQHPWYFVPTHITYKTKSKAEVDFGYGLVEVSVTEGEDNLGQEFVQNKFEVEFEPVDSMSAGDFAASVCEFAREVGLSVGDVTPLRLKVQETTLTRLKPFNGALGL